MHVATSSAFKENAPQRWTMPACRRRWPAAAPASSRAAPPRSPRCRSSSSCATSRATSRTTRWRISTSTWRTWEAKVLAVRRQGALVRHRRRGARRGAGDLPGRGRAHRHQGQVDDQRGAGHQRPPRTPRHHAGRDRPRRIHHPASPRTAQPHHCAGVPPQHGGLGGQLPQIPHRPAGRPRVPRTPRHPDRGAHQAARKSSWPPMSASPAPTS